MNVPEFPAMRMRRMRSSPALRRMVRETTLQPHQLCYPLFVCPGSNVRRPIRSLPGICQLSPDEAVREAEQAFRLGIASVLLFGIPESKDEQASGAYAENGIVQRAVRMLKVALPELIVITDVCLCEYMGHGHCGIVEHRAGHATIANDASLELLARTAASHVAAGADIVAPSDMMDGRVRAIRQRLDASGATEIPILAYAAKFASAFYGPFREAAQSTPQFGDRRSYQMDAANAREAMREVAMDIQEGADMVMVKPGLAYLDIIYRVKEQFGYPTAAYAVSAEYAMIKAAAANGWIDERMLTLETHLAMKRAGADLIITYAAPALSGWLKEL